ncbi:MAG TPA: Xaa-Pro dipeptidase [Kofleriaceae bacterium]|nr:Xaa-Pro dipeptidase [Kofleriaceae bacterium]
MSFETTYPDHVQHLQRQVEAALAQHKYEALVLCSGAAQIKNRFDDQWWPLSPTPAFTHWCPLVEPDAYLIVRAGRKPTLVRTIVDDFWETLAPPESDHFWSAFDTVTIEPGHAGDVLPGGKSAIVTRDPGTAPAGEVNPAALVASLDAIRTKKTPYEIECLARAEVRAVRGHRVAHELFAGGTPSELELHLAYLEATGHDDSGTPYKNIFALGAHAATLHHIAYETRAIAGDTSLLVDAGARCNGYGSDITRTYARGTGAAARRFADLIARMDKLQQEVCRRIKPGLAYEDLHDDSHRLLADVIRDLGLAKASAGELVDRGITRALFPHGLGHSLGVCVHDVGMKLRPPRADNKFLRNTSTIEVGQVFTIEPGIYFIDALLAPLRADDRARLVEWGAVDELRPFGGIRIEDNVVVAAGGIRNLTREAFAA